MCGIAGIVKLDPRERVEAPRLERMRDVLRHRGPDGGGCGRGPGGPRAPAAGHRGRRRRPAADDQRGRRGLDRLQRRDLQPRRRCVPGSRRAATATARAATPRRSCTSTRRRASGASSACDGMFALRALGPRGAAASPRARPARHQAALLRGHRRRAAVRLRDQGDPRGAARAAGVQRRGAARVPRHALRGGRARRSSAASASCCRAARSAWSPGERPSRDRYWRLPAPAEAAREGASAPPAEHARDVRAALEAAVREPPDERRAARPVPVRRHRLERAGRR